MRGILLSLLIVGTANAASITTKIHNILTPDKYGSEFLVMADSGDVFEISPDEEEILNAAYLALETNSVVTIDLSDLSINKLLGKRENISKIEISNNLSIPTVESEFDTNIPTPLDNYEFTTLNSYEDAQKLFKTQQNRTRRRSQCYNRAHVWSYEMSKRNVNSGKIWLFFTSRYIKEYKYKWWFHVAPYVKVAGEAEDIVMDRKFTRNPAPLSVWKNVFMKNKADCTTVEYYSDYRNNHFNGRKFCYIIKSSMYYWQPFNIENLEEGKEEKTSWNQDEMKKAYRNALKRWDGDLK